MRRIAAAGMAAIYCVALGLGLGCDGGAGLAKETRPTDIMTGAVVTHLTGLTRYQAQWDDQGTLNVVLRDGIGTNRGRMTVDDGVASLTLPNGDSAKMWSRVRGGEDGTIHSYRKLEARGEELEIQTLASGDGQHVLSMYYMTNHGAQALLVAENDRWLPPQLITQWAENTAQIPNLLGSEAARTLLLTSQDRALMTGTLQTQGYTPNATALVEHSACETTTEDPLPGTPTPTPTPTFDTPTEVVVPVTDLPGEGPSGDIRIHKSPLCGVILGALLGAAGGSVCAACLASVAALPAAGLSAIIAIPSCIWCGIVVGAGIADIVACLRSYWGSLTQDDCNRTCPSWATCQVNGDEHGCSTTCDNTRCDNTCKGQNYTSGQCGGRPGFGGNDCICINGAGQPTCISRR